MNAEQTEKLWRVYLEGFRARASGTPVQGRTEGTRALWALARGLSDGAGSSPPATLAVFTEIMGKATEGATS